MSCGKVDERDVVVDPGWAVDRLGDMEACSTEVTVVAGGTTTVEMRRGLDDPDDPLGCGFAVGTPTRSSW